MRAITPFEFYAKKMKTEKCEINAESIDVDAYLESFRASIVANSSIKIKKCAISGYATVESKNTGNIMISSLYTNPERRP